MLFRRFYRFLSAIISLVLVVVAGLGLYASRVCKLEALKGERVFYLDSASSQGLRKEELGLFDFVRVEGESVRFARDGETEEALVEEIKTLYGAEVLFCESAAGVTSYYCYTNEWTNGIPLNGVKVNLHIAVSETACAVGTPIIFGGF